MVRQWCDVQVDDKDARIRGLEARIVEKDTLCKELEKKLWGEGDGDRRPSTKHISRRLRRNQCGALCWHSRIGRINHGLRADWRGEQKHRHCGELVKHFITPLDFGPWLE